ncbi:MULTISPECIES: glutamine amidotransferase family protein [Rhodopseudomonas]|uniref:Glutamine amidotransferase n=1 Tax=Rhodopseudomonas palustris TaxID=1076 RepID=A0A0D7ELS1_RHOPL|nr:MULTISPECIES: glutamine amidotransferase family protein [Rhodopseudomonas]KIZ41616.1 glutamine amidotransferase [Rhodopseudomonas palustris]MDF3812545.1 glutamine amidotransferase family protein [Rhodopseudomonas sp. BAL398]WOK20660.1 glutamine amidotransferase family protein [Rhodopseudomonas sp. BAL398]
MCGIVGLFLKNKTLEPALGEMLSKMLVTMSARGPDSAGMAIYGASHGDKVKLTLRAEDVTSIDDLVAELSAVLTAPLDVSVRANHFVVAIVRDDEAAALRWLKIHKSELQLVSVGSNMEIYKDVGLPAHVVSEFGLSTMSGSHGIGHTRMATESAITIDGAHPFSTGQDQCLVHNGSLSNHNSIRRNLVREGMTFSTQNDSEVAAGYLTWRMSKGDSLKQSLTSSLDDLDGFFTFVVGTRTGFAVLRDPIACKPAIMAESDDYVAFGSEYRALSVLPAIEKARVFEPEPATVYAWERS